MGQVYQRIVLPTAELQSSLSNLDFEMPTPARP